MNKEELKSAVKKLNNYFVEKIVDDDYKVKSVSVYTAEIVIDDDYHFSLWIGNGRENLRCYQINDNFMTLSFTDEQKATIFLKLKAIQSKDFTKKRISELERELNALKRG